MEKTYCYGIALIDYKSGKRTCRFLKDFLSVCDIRPNVIVIVDNGADDNTSFTILQEMLADPTEESMYSDSRIQKTVKGTIDGINAVLLKAGENLGYAKANNIAAGVIREHRSDSILFSNSDILFDCGELKVSALLQKLKEDPRILGIGSDVINLKGEQQSPCCYLSIEDRYWREKLLWPLLKYVYRRKNEVIQNLGKEQKVYRLIGAFFAVNVTNFFAAGGFDEHTFLYAEELILAERALQHGFYMYYLPGIKVIHEDGYTMQSETENHEVPITKETTELNVQRFMKELDSDLYYYKTYRHVSDAKCRLTRMIMKSYLRKRNIIYRLQSR